MKDRTEFEAYLARGAVLTTRVTCVLVAGLILIGWVLDITSHPEQKFLLLRYRLTTSLFTLFLFALTHWKPVQKYMMTIFFVALLTCAGTIQY